MNKTIFLLGAPDPEMQEIQNVLYSEGLPFLLLMRGGKRAAARDAYEAQIDNKLQAGNIVLVEGNLKDRGLLKGRRITIVDHHFPGNPGYGMPPKDYMKASSLGQVLAILGKEPTDEQRIIAAADHCLMAAYAGECPGVAPADLAMWRAKSRSKFLNLPLDDYLEQVNQARSAIMSLPRITVNGYEFADARGLRIKELPEAAAQLLTPTLYSTPMPKGVFKEGVLAASPQHVRVWKHWAMDRTEGQLDKVYGDPMRGIAGGYRDARQPLTGLD